MRGDRRSPWIALAALGLAAGAGGGCRPRLPADLVATHSATPRAAPLARVAASADRPPGWLQGGRTTHARIFVGQASAADLDEALSAAERDLGRQVARALGVELDARFVSTSREGPEGADDAAHGAVRLRDGARAVTPDARYWERLEGGGAVRHRAFARLEVAASELLRAQAARRARRRPGSDRAQVVLRFEGPRAAAMERQVFFATAGAPRFAVVDPALVEAAGVRAPAAVQAALTPDHVVVGRIELDEATARLAMYLEAVGGGTSKISAGSWAQLAQTLPVALQNLLFGPRSHPAPSKGGS